MIDPKLTSVESDPVDFRPTYRAHLGPVGMTAIHCASFALAGLRLDDGKPQSIMMLLGRPGCDCGQCDMPGRAFEYRPTPEHARMLAADLVRAADELEAAAKRSASTLLDQLRPGSAR